MGSPLPSLINNKEKPHTVLPNRIYRKINYSDVWQTEWRAKLQLHRCAPTNCSLGPLMAFAMADRGVVRVGEGDRPNTHRTSRVIHSLCRHRIRLIDNRGLHKNTTATQTNNLRGLSLRSQHCLLPLCLAGYWHWLTSSMVARAAVVPHPMPSSHPNWSFYYPIYRAPLVDRVLTEPYWIFWSTTLTTNKKETYTRLVRQTSVNLFRVFSSTFQHQKKKRHTKKNERRIERKIKVTPERRSSTHDA